MQCWNKRWMNEWMNEMFILLSRITFVNENINDCHEINKCMVILWMYMCKNECICAYLHLSSQNLLAFVYFVFFQWSQISVRNIVFSAKTCACFYSSMLYGVHDNHSNICNKNLWRGCDEVMCKCLMPVLCHVTMF